MAEIKVEMNSDDVNKAIADAIMRSMLGETIVKMTNEYVKSLTTRYDDPVKKVIETEIHAIIKTLVLERRDEIAEAVKIRLADDVVNKIVEKGIEAIKRLT